MMVNNEKEGQNEISS